jgi:hypothetical protein
LRVKSEGVVEVEAEGRDNSLRKVNQGLLARQFDFSERPFRKGLSG